MRKVEVCAANPASVRAAAENGADRVELCSALSLDGLTPSAGLIKYALSFPSLRVHVLIRPREGNFVYTSDEIEVMVQDIAEAKRLGAHGVVIGALKSDGTIDIPACRRLMESARGMDVTFHRAFDTVPSPFDALEEIISLGCSRILTSGQAASAEAGIPMLARLHSEARGRIKILAGAGVKPENARRIAVEGLADELHGSFSVVKPDGQRVTSPEYTRTISNILNALP